MQHFVLGFAFNSAKDIVVLIEKQKPDWQKDLLNGVGGKVEPKETPRDAMIREFKEETGLETAAFEWDLFATLEGNNYLMYCFRLFTDDIMKVKTMEAELIQKVTVTYALGKAPIEAPIVNSLKVLLPMALDQNFHFAEMRHIGED
jgi:8-oxo-dGTP diphosphatase